MSQVIVKVSGGSISPSSLIVNGPSTFNGAQYVKRTATAINYNVLNTDYLVAVTSTGSPRSIVLPANPAPVVAGTVQLFIVKDEGGGAAVNNITVTVSGGGLIDGQASYILDSNYESGYFYFVGGNYYSL